jgi:hypothetical protein
MYQSRELRDDAAKTVVHESSRGFRLGKTKGSDRVDAIVALAMGVLLAGREESVGGRYDVRDFYSGELIVPNASGIDDQTGLPLIRQRPPSFKPMARPESELDPDAPRHPGVTFWDFVDARGLDPNDPVVPAAHQQALAEYRRAMAEYRAKKADTAVDDVELVRS